MLPARNEANPTRGNGGRRVLCLLSTGLLAAACESDTGGCIDTLGIVITSGNLYSTVEFDAEARWAAGGRGCPDTYTWSATAPLTIVAPGNGPHARVVGVAGTGRISVRAGSGTEFTAARDVEVLSSTGWALLTVAGLDADVLADIVLTGPSGETVEVDGDATVGGLVPGTWSWRINDVTGGIGHRWVGVLPMGTFTILRNTPTLLPLAYRRLTAQIDFEARNVHGGTIGSFVTLTSDGGETHTFTTPDQSLGVEAGHYTWTATAVDERGFWFVPRILTGEFRLQPAFTVPFILDYDAQRGFLDIRAEGIPPDVEIIGTLLDGGNFYTVSIPGAGYRSPAEYALDVPELTDHPNFDANRYETYRATLPTQQINLTRGGQLVLVVAMYIATWHATFDSDFTITADPFNFAPVIGLPAGLDLRVTASQPPPATGDAASNAVDTMIGIMGPPPWVPVTGSLAADSTFTATGTGAVAGYPGVLVTFTGRLLADGSLAGDLVLGSDTAPTGLPGGAVRMSVNADRQIIPSSQESTGSSSPARAGSQSGRR